MKAGIALLTWMVAVSPVQAESSGGAGAIKLTLGPVSESPQSLIDPFGKPYEMGSKRKILGAQRRGYILLDAPGPGYRRLSGEDDRSPTNTP